ncbi:WD40-repeat-containing domain protein [Clohesyomyces aquaticus]|uniref:WD40-repeat-containing domain protein n=1 Tax=Clohesyomyces aquaticus TaxID=1231657 RepID=A0A1Y1YD97_9PLEO|nr:WD40-repeat-containing domain protein [Clohesyomyces aquaticus]
MSEFDDCNYSNHDTKSTADGLSFRIPRADRQDQAHTNRIYTLCISLNFLVTGSYDRTVRVWSKSNRALALPPLTNHQSSVLAVEVSEELDLICSGDGNGKILLWSLSRGNMLDTVDAHDASIFGFSLEARNLVSVSRDRTAKLWRILGDLPEPRRLKHRCTLTGHEWPILAVKFHESRVITTSKDCLRIWSVEDGSCLEKMSNFASIWEFDIIPKSERLQIVCACTNSRLRIYDLTGKKETACLMGHEGVARIVKVLASPSVPGHKIISAGYDGTVRIWVLDAVKEAWQNVQVLSFSDTILTPFGDEVETVEVEEEEFLGVRRRAKRIFDMKIDGNVAYVVGEGAEVLAFDLDDEKTKHTGQEDQ